MSVIEIDFETEAIEPRPEYPPKPVGVAIGWMGNGGRRYYAWGHPTENNCTKSQAVKILKDAYKSNNELVFHNAGFDLDVAEVHLGLKHPRWDLINDTLFLVFLHNPYEVNLSLKPLADKYLDMPPDEQTNLKDWILNNVKTPDGKGIAPTKWGAYISKAPGNLVGKYAVGDIIRTGQLFKKFRKLVFDAGMREAYDRERRFLFAKLSMERRGVPIASARLRRDTNTWQRSLDRVDEWLAKRLKTPNLDVDSNMELADALDKVGAVNEWILTENENRSLAKKNIEKCIVKSDILNVLDYRGTLANGIRNFANSWNRMSEKEGRIYCTWNQVRNNDERGKSNVGARTGRPSSTPNFQNIPKKPKLIAFSKSEAIKMKPTADQMEVDIITMPSALKGEISLLPNLRDYIVPDKGKQLNIRDWSQQELRIMAHYEGSVLRDAYQSEPSMDIHSLAQTLINKLTMRNFSRRPIKITGFGLIYGMGVDMLAERTGQNRDEAQILKESYLSIFPGLSQLIRDLKRRARRGEPIHTWGGRVYYVEPPRLVKGRMRSFDYKLLNTLIQGSAADSLKEASIIYSDETKDGELLITVHDEFITQAPFKSADSDMKLLKDIMASLDFDVPMLSDGKTSKHSWARAKKYKDPS